MPELWYLVNRQTYSSILITGEKAKMHLQGTSEHAEVSRLQARIDNCETVPHEEACFNSQSQLELEKTEQRKYLK